MGLNVGSGNRCCVSCDVAGCRNFTASFWGQDETAKIVEQRGWQKDDLTGNWACPDCRRAAINRGAYPNRFKTAPEILAAAASAIGDVLGNHPVVSNGERLIVSKTSLNSAQLRELKQRFYSWGLKVEETESNLSAAAAR